VAGLYEPKSAAPPPHTHTHYYPTLDYHACCCCRCCCFLPKSLLYFLGRAPCIDRPQSWTVERIAVSWENPKCNLRLPPTIDSAGLFTGRLNVNSEEDTGCFVPSLVRFYVGCRFFLWHKDYPMLTIDNGSGSAPKKRQEVGDFANFGTLHHPINIGHPLTRFYIAVP
jgi:hypothetical protein